MSRNRQAGLADYRWFRASERFSLDRTVAAPRQAVHPMGRARSLHKGSADGGQAAAWPWAAAGGVAPPGPRDLCLEQVRGLGRSPMHLRRAQGWRPVDGATHAGKSPQSTQEGVAGRSTPGRLPSLVGLGAPIWQSGLTEQWPPRCLVRGNPLTQQDRPTCNCRCITASAWATSSRGLAIIGVLAGGAGHRAAI